MTRFFWDPVTVLFLLAAGWAVFNLVAYRNLSAGVRPVPGFPFILAGFTTLVIASMGLSAPTPAAKQQVLFISSAAALYAAVRQLSDPYKQALSDCVRWTMGIAALLFLGAFAAGGRVSSYDRTQLFVNDNVMASFTAAGVFFGLGLLKRSKIAAGALISACAAVLFVTQSALAALSLGLALIVVRGKMRPALSVAAGAAALAFGAGVVMRSPWMKDSVANRLDWWGECFKMISQAPWLGFGPGSFETASRPFADPGLRSAFAHSFILQGTVETGIPAFLLLALLIKNMVSAIEDPLLLGAALTLLFHGCADFTLNIPGIFLFLVLLSALGSKPFTLIPHSLTPLRSRLVFASIFVISSLIAWQGGLWLAKT